MCGIIGYIGNKNIQKILIQGLLRLEYRGYDSAGIALNRSSGFYLSKEKGRVLNLEKAVDAEQKGESGIGHTRWATHGGVTKENAHPHKSQDGRVCIVHNGIIENYKDLKKKIKGQGIHFKSETDTEVISQLISLYYSGKTISGEDSETKDKPLESIRETIKLLRGTWGLSIMFEGDTDKIYVARNGSPLIVGLDDECSYISSDPHAIMTFTKKVIFLNDGEIGIVKKNDLELFREDGATKDVLVEYLKEEWGVGEKGDYPHFMIKEIFDQPESLKRCINGRLNKSEGSARLGGININHKKFKSVKLINMIGSGTAFYAAQAGCYIAQGLSGVKATPLVASEYRDNNPVVNEDMLFFAFSQSGETADTLSAVKEIKLKGGTVRGVINVVGSTIARTCGSGVYIHSGPEMSVASTKAYSNMIAAASLFSLQLARSRKLDINHGQDFANELEKIPEKVHSYLERYENLQPKLEQAVNLIKNTKFVFFIGRGVSTSVAYEGALKLMEISYIPSIAYAGGELKHGPIALIEDGTPVVVIAPKDHHKEKTISNMQECKARGAKIILIHTEGDDIEKEADISFAVPDTNNLLSPLLTILPLQLLAYKTALALNRDIDKPRNLAKSVTVM